MDSRETSSPSLWGRLTRDRRFDKHTVARKLISHCLSLQSNSGCTLSPSFNSGSEHVVKLIEFEDGITWVARLPLPAYMDDESGRFASNWKTRVDSEVATHRFIRQNTNIPVPEIHSFDTSFETVGWPFILMEYIRGKAAREQLASATPEQDIHFLKQMPKIQVKLAKIQMNKIGSIFQSSDGFEIGPDVETALGPLEKPKQYYEAVASHRDRRCTAHRPFETKKLFGGLDLPALFGLCLNSVADGYTEDGFGLANRDLGPQNLLVDEDFNVVALIDLNFVLSGPLHVIASLPQRYYSDLDTRSSDLGVMKRTKEYLNALSTAGRPDSCEVTESPLAKFWVELERLNHAFFDESISVDTVRSFMRFAIQNESFVGEGRGKPDRKEQ